MIKLKADHVVRILNTAVRLASLAGKLLLTLYMGRYLPLADMGMYGLVAGTVMILVTALGFRFDFIVSRELVETTPYEALFKMRGQAILFGLNHIFLAVVMFILTCVDITGLSPKVMLTIFLLAVGESYGNMTYMNLNSMGRPLLANLLLFIRSGLWVVPAACMGFLAPEFRNSDTIFAAWGVGIIASMAITMWIWRDMPWKRVMKARVDWDWIIKGVKRSFFIWLGSLGTSVGAYTDRFVVAHDLGLDLAGVATFYSSFTLTLYTLVQSGVLFFSYPHLIRLHRKHDKKGFKRESWKLAWHVAAFAGVIAVGLGLVVPLLGYFLHRPLLVDLAPTLWLMLFGMWIRENSETLYYVLFARHQDRAIWLGDLLYLIPAFGANAILVPLMGFNGIGYSMIIASLFLLIWRGWYVVSKAGMHDTGGLQPEKA